MATQPVPPRPSYNIQDVDNEPDYSIVPPELTNQHIPLTAMGPTLHVMLKRLEEPSVRIVQVDGVQVVDNVDGLAELLAINGSVTNCDHADLATVAAVLDAWGRDDQRASCARLWQLLVSLGRFDVLRVIRLRLLQDARLYVMQRHRQRPPSPLPAPQPDTRRFDVYVSYCETSHEDAGKAAEVVQRLRDHQLEVVSAEDRLAGVFSHEEFHNIVSRCKRVAILWSRAYHSEEQLRFELNHARSTDPAAVRRRVIPVLLDDTPLPGHMSGIVTVRFGNRNWIRRLVNSLKDCGG